MVNIIEHIRNFSKQKKLRELFSNLTYLLSIFKKRETFETKSNSNKQRINIEYQFKELLDLRLRLRLTI